MKKTYQSHSDVGALRGMYELAKEAHHYRRVILNMVRQQLTRSYIRSKLGAIWVILNPVLTIMVLSLLFPLLMRNRMENYVVYLFSGLVAYNYISTALNGGSGCIVQNEKLMKKIYIPKIVFPIVQATSELVSMAMTLISLHIISYIFSFAVHTKPIHLAFSLVLMYGFALGVSFITSLLAVVVSDVRQVVGMLMRALFFLTPIIYSIENLPARAQYWMEFNPVFQYVRLFHDSIYSAANPDLSIFYVPAALTSGVLIFGLFVQWRYGRNAIYYL